MDKKFLKAGFVSCGVLLRWEKGIISIWKLIVAVVYDLGHTTI
jgi:hypothetical protein